MRLTPRTVNAEGALLAGAGAGVDARARALARGGGVDQDAWVDPDAVVRRQRVDVLERVQPICQGVFLGRRQMPEPTERSQGR